MVDASVQVGIFALLLCDSGLQLALLLIQVVDNLLLLHVFLVELTLLLLALDEEFVLSGLYTQYLVFLLLYRGFLFFDDLRLHLLIARIFRDIAEAATHLAKIFCLQDEQPFVERHPVVEEVDHAVFVALFAEG